MKKMISIILFLVVTFISVPFSAENATDVISATDSATLVSSSDLIVDEEVLEDSWIYHKIPKEAITEKAIWTVEYYSERVNKNFEYDWDLFEEDYKALPFVFDSGLFMMWETSMQDYYEKLVAEDYKAYIMLGDEKAQVYAYTVKQGEYELALNSLVNPYLTEALLAELRSIQPYMVFENKICQVQQVIPVSNEYGSWAIYYQTNEGVFVKYLEFPEALSWSQLPEAKGKALLFTENEFAECRESVFGERRRKNEEYFQEHGVYPIGSVASDLLGEMLSAEKELPFCEPGNPVPEHLQAEMNSLLGVNAAPDNSSDVSTDTATDTATTDAIPSGGENVSFPWLWIALPVGAVGIAGGAAFVLLRKKRKASPAP